MHEHVPSCLILSLQDYAFTMITRRRKIPDNRQQSVEMASNLHNARIMCTKFLVKWLDLQATQVIMLMIGWRS